MTNQFLAIIGVGSNIDPVENVKKAEITIANIATLKKNSTVKVTKPLLFENQEDFLNGAFLISTDMSIDRLTAELKAIEIKLGRVKTENKNGPRTIDLDVIVYDGKVVDSDVYERDFLKEAVLELMPDFEF